MTYGESKETADQIKQRHKNELKEDYLGWLREKEHAVRAQDLEYEKFCQEQTEIFSELLKNTFDFDTNSLINVDN